VKEIVAVGVVVSSTSTVNIVGSRFAGPQGVAVDGGGNVFVADTGHSAVKEIVAVGVVVSSSSTVNTVGSGFSSPSSVVVDGSGNVFVADQNHNAVKEIVAVGGVVSSSSAVNTVGSGFNYPYGVAVDSSGNVFVADTNNSAVKQIVAGTGGAASGTVNSSSTVNTLGSGFSYPAGVTVDGSGNVFVADAGNSAVKEIDLSDPPSLSFASTEVGSTSSDSPQTVTVANSGNATLTFTALTPATDFNFSGTDTTCTASTSLTAGNSCLLGVVFAPQSVNAGFTESVSATNNTLNVAGTIQAICVSGAGTVSVATPTIMGVSPSSGPATGGTTVTITGTNFTGVTGVKFGTTAATGVTFGSATSITATSPAGTGTVDVTVTTPNGTSATSSSDQFTYVATAPTITFTVANQTYGAAPFTVAATSNSSGAITYSVVSGSATIVGSTVTLTGVGTVVLQASEAAAGNYASGTQTATFTVAQATLTLTLTANNATRVYGTANPVFTGTPTGQQSGDTFTEAFSTTAVQLSQVASYAIIPAAVGAHLADYTQSIQNGTLSITQAGTTATLSAGTQNAIAGQNNSYTATITSLTSGTPTGTVQYFDNGNLFGSATLVAGQAVLTSAALGVGNNTITILYLGDVNFQPNSTTGTSATVSVTLPDFTFTLTSASTVAIPFGGTASFTLQLTPLSGNYYQPVVFSNAATSR
jgi:hypothetical protein